MKKIIFFIFIFLSIFQKSFSAEAVRKASITFPERHIETTHQNITNLDQLSQLEYQIRGDFGLFLQELYNERERGKKEGQIIADDMRKTLEDTKVLINESRKEIVTMSSSETRNLLIASIFLWISITIFIIMNLVFAINLKKELYFLRNGLLRSEIKESMVELSKQLTDLTEKLETINKGN